MTARRARAIDLAGQDLLPPLSRRALVGLFVVWLVLLTAAGWLKTHRGIVTGVLGDVLASAAGLAFGATGLAAAVLAWQRRRLVTELAPLASVRLVEAAGSLEAFMAEILMVYTPIWPLVRDLVPPADIAIVVRPPSRPEALAVVSRLRLSATWGSISRGVEGKLGPLRVREERLEQHTHARRCLDILSSSQSSGDLPWRQMEALIPVLGGLQIDRAAEAALAQRIEQRASSVIDAGQHLLETLESLRGLHLPYYREVSLSAAALEAAMWDWSKGMEDADGKGYRDVDHALLAPLSPLLGAVHGVAYGLTATRGRLASMKSRSPASVDGFERLASDDKAVSRHRDDAVRRIAERLTRAFERAEVELSAGEDGSQAYRPSGV